MSARGRTLFPWEARCGCPTCKVRPRQRCITMRSRYEGRGPLGPGQPTTAHKARYELWAYLWGRWLAAGIGTPGRLFDVDHTGAYDQRKPDTGRETA